ncbi:LADA_0C04324g1_1 [Lachancea dasiensis]|uniref:LADA_0C04324g1_1 n=1 Tax=Lachancea dasiensis TaxID=1072105 RepID=A0A1G4IZ02_9SACH|nr:LADA_0C04324g1_1 [Lachancea dasiensis]
MTEHQPTTVVKQRSNDFRHHLINQLCLLGITVIIIHYLKFGSSTAALFFRLLVQSVLSKVQVFAEQFRRISMRAHSRRIPGSRMQDVGEAAAPNEGNPPMPGTFTTTADIQEQLSEEVIENTANEAEYNMRWLLFHCCFTFNCISILMALIWPLDYHEKMGIYQFHADGIGLIPSPFDNGNGRVGGELQRTLFVQLIGERVPGSNFWGNATIVFLEFVILILQSSLYVLTAHNFAQPLSNTDDVSGSNGNEDQFGGSVLVTTINPVAVLNTLLHERYDQFDSQPAASEMV